jgi:hypothetical protein
VEQPLGTQRNPTRTAPHSRLTTQLPTLCKRRHPQHRHQTSPCTPPACLCFQPDAVNLPTSHPAWPFPLVARLNRIPRHQTLGQVPRNQQRSSAHATKKHPVHQTHRKPTACHIPGFQPLPRAPQHSNPCCVHRRSPRRRTPALLLRPNRQIPSPIVATPQLCHGPLRLSQLQLNGYAPELHILDNECSDELKKAFKKYDVNSYTAATPPKGQSRPGKIIFAQASPHATPNSPSPNGTSSCRKPPLR